MVVSKHNRGRRFRRYIPGSIDHKVNVGVLASKTVLKTDIASTVIDSTWCSSIRATWSVNGITKFADRGPLLVGICHSDYTSTEVEEWLESLVNWDQGNKVAQERARRMCRIVGVFEDPVSAATAAVLNDGKPITTKVGWLLAPGQTLGIWVYNQGSVAYASTDPDMQVVGKANLWPQ